MHFSIRLLPILAAVLSALAHEPVMQHRHRELARRAKGDVTLAKRYDNARWSYYEVGQGACGIVNVPSDFIVALNTAQYGDGYPGPNCFKTITMTYNGKTAVATITDQCPGCPYGGLDLSQGLFNYFADESAGIIYGTWSFNDGSSNAATTTSQYVPPTTSSTWQPPPTTSTSTWTPPTSTSSTYSYVAPSSSSSSSWSSSSSAISSSAISSSASPSSSDAADRAAATSSGTVVTLNDNQPNNIYNVNGALVNLANLAVQAQRVL